MEAMVEKNPWVSNAEMFLDNNQVLQVRIEERQPVARVFTLDGNSFYLDSAALRLPLSDKISARVPMFTRFPIGKPVLAKPDSLHCCMMLLNWANISWPIHSGWHRWLRWPLPPGRF
jgi:cell division protein FtsQ